MSDQNDSLARSGYIEPDSTIEDKSKVDTTDLYNTHAILAESAEKCFEQLLDKEKQIKSLKDDLEEAREIIFDLFNQACQCKYDRETNTAYYDNMCLTAYESAQDYLLTYGIIKHEQCTRK